MSSPGHHVQPIRSIRDYKRRRLIRAGFVIVIIFRYRLQRDFYLPKCRKPFIGLFDYFFAILVIRLVRESLRGIQLIIFTVISDEKYGVRIDEINSYVIFNNCNNCSNPCTSSVRNYSCSLKKKTRLSKLESQKLRLCVLFHQYRRRFDEYPHYTYANFFNMIHGIFIFYNRANEII